MFFQSKRRWVSLRHSDKMRLNNNKKNLINLNKVTFIFKNKLKINLNLCKSRSLTFVLLNSDDYYPLMNMLFDHSTSKKR